MHQVVKILITTSVFCNIAFALMEPIYAIYVQQIGGSILEAATSVGLYSIVLGVTTIIIGKVSDRGTIKNKLIVAGYGIGAIAFLGYYFVRNPFDLFLVQILLGFGTALIDPGWNALFGRYVSRGKEAFEWGAWEGGKQIAIGVFSVVGGVIAAVFGFKVLILSMFVFEVLATISVSRLLTL